MKEDDFAALRAEYRAELPGVLERLERLRAELVAGRAAEGGRRALLREVHSLAGSGRTFGLAGVSAAARAAEELLEQPGEPDWARLAALFAEIRRQL